MERSVISPPETRRAQEPVSCPEWTHVLHPLETHAIRASGSRGQAKGTYLIFGQGFQMLQDLSHHRLTQLVVFGQKLGVSPIQAVIGVN